MAITRGVSYKHYPNLRFPHRFIPWSNDMQDIKRLNEEILAWCLEQFGPYWNGGWMKNLDTYNFADDKQAFAFKMRWMG